MTFVQAKAIESLTELHWRTVAQLGHPQAVGGPLLMEDPQGGQHVVESAGDVRAATAAEKREGKRNANAQALLSVGWTWDESTPDRLQLRSINGERLYTLTEDGGLVPVIPKEP